MRAMNSESPRRFLRVPFRLLWHLPPVRRRSGDASPGHGLRPNTGSLNPSRSRRFAGVPRASRRFMPMRAGGARVVMGCRARHFWGALAMAVTAGVGWLFA